MSEHGSDPPPLTDDPANERLRALVETRTSALAAKNSKYDLIAVGGGTAGLVATAGMAILGAKVALVERNLLGGDCLVTGCVPSKTLLHAGQLAHDARLARSIGIVTGDVDVDFPKVMRKLRETRAAIAQDDSVSTVSKRGIDVIHGSAAFCGPNTLEVDGATLTFKRCLIATGGRPRLPDIPGLDEANPLTNETLFELEERPPRLAVVGGGPIGCEMAQAMSRLGCAVTLVQRGERLLPKDDPDASSIIADALRQEGVVLHLKSELRRITQEDGATTLYVGQGETVLEIECDRVLVATGRQANLDGLGLDKAGVEFDRRGIVVDDKHRSTNRRVYAAGDVAGRHQFTHAAWAQAEYAVLNAFFPVWLDVSARIMPWATYTDPEVAHVGLTQQELAALGDGVQTLTIPVGHNDRAHIEGETAGFARVHLRTGSDKILAGTIVGKHAGELIVPIAMAMTRKIGLSKLTSTIVPYPTRSELVRDLAYEYGTRRITPTIRRWAQRWFSLLR